MWDRVPFANLRTDPSFGDGNVRKFVRSAEPSATTTTTWNQPSRRESGPPGWASRPVSVHARGRTV